MYPDKRCRNAFRQYTKHVVHSRMRSRSLHQRVMPNRGVAPAPRMTVRRGLSEYSARQDWYGERAAYPLLANAPEASAVVRRV
jgi:hypothetical protein